MTDLVPVQPGIDFAFRQERASTSLRRPRAAWRRDRLDRRHRGEVARAGREVRDISDLTGFPGMMDGRVKTLHPKVHGGLLGVRDNPEHVAAMDEHEIAPIDLVVVNLYPFPDRS